VANWINYEEGLSAHASDRAIQACNRGVEWPTRRDCGQNHLNFTFELVTFDSGETPMQLNYLRIYRVALSGTMIRRIMLTSEPGAETPSAISCMQEQDAKYPR
jgi:hypothetical protein